MQQPTDSNIEERANLRKELCGISLKNPGIKPNWYYPKLARLYELDEKIEGPDFNFVKLESHYLDRGAATLAQDVRILDLFKDKTLSEILLKAMAKSRRANEKDELLHLSTCNDPKQLVSQVIEGSRDTFSGKDDAREHEGIMRRWSGGAWERLESSTNECHAISNKILNKKLPLTGDNKRKQAIKMSIRRTKSSLDKLLNNSFY